jgi:D-alanyl-D-alanine carboxypeptidase (penicillin-binding protein 5/6)
MRHDISSRSYLRKKKRQRQLVIRIGIFAAAVIGAGVVVSGGIHPLKNNISQTKNSTKTESAYTDGITADVQPEEEEQELSKYPSKSSTYEEITSEEVKSPYVALLDVENNEIIAGRNMDTKIYPASMTKVLTLIVAVEHLTDLDATFTMTGELVDPLVRQDASRAGFEAGDTVTVKDMLYGLILPSGADAAVGLAVMTAGSEEAFAELMNEKCEELGLVSSHFMNASGLYDDNQYTTPVEMAMILKYAMENETCAEVLSTYQYITAPLNSNPEGVLLTSTMFSRMYGTEVEGVLIQAGKTGYTQEAKHCLVSYAEKGEHHYIALTAGAESKWYVVYDDFELYGKYLP